MRGIKFRAWDSNFNKMIYSEQFSVSFVGRIFYGNADMTGYPMEINQYTGLKDKNGKEIYEGDLVKWIIESINYPGVFREHICEVFRNKQGAYRLRGQTIYETELCCNRKKVEVIGNVYEDSHLLEGATNGSS